MRDRGLLLSLSGLPGTIAFLSKAFTELSNHTSRLENGYRTARERITSLITRKLASRTITNSTTQSCPGTR